MQTVLTSGKTLVPTKWCGRGQNEINVTCFVEPSLIFLLGIIPNIGGANEFTCLQFSLVPVVSFHCRGGSCNVDK